MNKIYLLLRSFRTFSEKSDLYAYTFEHLVSLSFRVVYSLKKKKMTAMPNVWVVLTFSIKVRMLRPAITIGFEEMMMLNTKYVIKLPDVLRFTQHHLCNSLSRFQAFLI